MEIVVATPGRLGDLIDAARPSSDAIQITVLDEADQMADMGFLPEVTECWTRPGGAGSGCCSRRRSTVTSTHWSSEFMHDPVTHSIAAERVVDDHGAPPAAHTRRTRSSITAESPPVPGRTIMFVRTQLAVDRLAKQLPGGVRAGALHGGEPDAAHPRPRRVPGRHGAGGDERRGPGHPRRRVSLVVHVDPPKDPKDYLHRAGRTARAGEDGTVVTLVCPTSAAPWSDSSSDAGVDAVAGQGGRPATP